MSDELEVADFVAETDGVEPSDISAETREDLNEALNDVRPDTAPKPPEPPIAELESISATGSESLPLEVTATVAGADGDLDGLSGVQLNFRTEEGNRILNVQKDIDPTLATVSISEQITEDDDLLNEPPVGSVSVGVTEEGGEPTTIATRDVEELLAGPSGRFEIVELTGTGSPDEGFDLSITIADDDDDDDLVSATAEAQTASGARVGTGENVVVSESLSGGEGTAEFTLTGSGVNGDTAQIAVFGEDDDGERLLAVRSVDSLGSSDPASRFSVETFGLNENNNLKAQISDADGDDDLRSVTILNQDDRTENAGTDVESGKSSLSVTLEEPTDEATYELSAEDNDNSDSLGGVLLRTKSISLSPSDPANRFRVEKFGVNQGGGLEAQISDADADDDLRSVTIINPDDRLDFAQATGEGDKSSLSVTLDDPTGGATYQLSAEDSDNSDSTGGVLLEEKILSSG